jgi:hypothetical protein
LLAAYVFEATKRPDMMRMSKRPEIKFSDRFLGFMGDLLNWNEFDLDPVECKWL